jgi:hypothetical protein
MPLGDSYLVAKATSGFLEKEDLSGEDNTNITAA